MAASHATYTRHDTTDYTISNARGFFKNIVGFVAQSVMVVVWYNNNAFRTGILLSYLLDKKARDRLRKFLEYVVLAD